jgi:hypothetical protein
MIIIQIIITFDQKEVLAENISWKRREEKRRETCARKQIL